MRASLLGAVLGLLIYRSSGVASNFLVLCYYKHNRDAPPTRPESTMNAATQLLQAANLGTAAFRAGIKCAPCLDKNLLAMFAGRQIGEIPEGQAGTVKLMDAWTKAWTAANLAA